MSIFKLGTRGSPLALAQTREVEAALRRAIPALAEPDAIETIIIRTTGDKIQNRALADEGGKALFVKEIEEALLDRRIDIGVHSAKDLPTILPEGLTIGAVFKTGRCARRFLCQGRLHAGNAARRQHRRHCQPAPPGPGAFGAAGPDRQADAR